MARTAELVSNVMPATAGPPELQVLPFSPRYLWRVHPKHFPATQPYTAAEQDSAFAPIYRQDGSSIPLLFAATCLQGVLWSTLFHEVPAVNRAGYLLDFAKLEARELCVSRIRPRKTLQLAQTPGPRLAPPGVQREPWSQWPVLAYRESRDWIKHCYATTSAQGLLWDIPEFNEPACPSQAVLLFGDRLDASLFSAKTQSTPLCSGEVLHSIVALSDAIGIGGVYGV